MRYLAVDPGGRRFGLAVGDDRTGVVTPLAVLPYGGIDPAAERIVEEARRLGAGAVVVGLPVGEDGEPAGGAVRSERLGAAIERLGLPVRYQAEFLTTDEARRRARALGLPARGPVDHLAAQVILEEFLASERR